MTKSPISTGIKNKATMINTNMKSHLRTKYTKAFIEFQVKDDELKSRKRPLLKEDGLAGDGCVQSLTIKAQN